MTPATARFPRGLLALLATIVVVATASISCGDGASMTTTNATEDLRDVIVVASPRTGQATTAAPTPAPNAPIATTSRRDLLGEVPATPSEVRVDPDDDRVLLVRYTGGLDPCHGARVAVDEGPASVRVLLFLGTPPEAVGTACYTIGVDREVAVPLDRPLGTRDLSWR